MNNFYEFSKWLIEFSMTSTESFFMSLGYIIAFIYMVNKVAKSLASFRLIENKSGKSQSKEVKLEDENINNLDNSDSGMQIYDMLMDAYDSYKKRKK